MNSSLLDQFLADDCTPHVQLLLEQAIADHTAVRPHFDFNRFEVTVDRVEGAVVIEDVLDATGAGIQAVPLVEFLDALKRRSA